MMTPLRFEETYGSEWLELEMMLNVVLGKTVDPSIRSADVSGARLAALYRRACEHLALARSRSYPAYLIDRLDRLTADGHQLIYHRHDVGLARLKHTFAVDFPSTVRKHIAYVAAATAVFLLPTVIVGLLVYGRPELILSVVSSEKAAQFEEMYSPAAHSIGQTREATTDWVMFAFYIRNNVGVSFQCFAGGLFAGLGTLFFLAYNGAFTGALAGYLTERGLSTTFYSFVATHSAFELTAIVLSGAAGLRMGHALLAPGRMTRMRSLVETSHDSAILLYGITAMLLIAAAIEAFWSSANWLPPAVKYGAAALCWTAVFGYFAFQGRRAS